MYRWKNILAAEVVKQHRNWFNSKITYFSLLIWPILIFINVYLTYKPFEGIQDEKLYHLLGHNSLAVFLTIGFLGYNSFWSMVQSAWQMSYERQSGTLDIIFMSPANKLMLLYGRALGAIFENIWMFSLFAVIMLFINQNFSLSMILKLPIVFLILIVTAAIWGGLMNVIFLFSRDATLLFNILDEPMVLFSGVRIPTQIFPLWSKIISLLFPLTYTLSMIRKILSNQQMLLNDFFLPIIVNCLTVGITALLIKLAEKKARKTGEFGFY